jgi:FtsX-like permease family
VNGPGGTARFDIVGSVVFPSLGDSLAVADGAIFTGRGLDRIDDPAAELSHAWVVATVGDTTDRRAIERQLGRLPGVGDPETSGVEAPRLPLEVRRLRQVDDLPIILAGLLALLGTAAIGYTLVTSIRRRQNELAVLKTLGFTRRQLAAVVAWQATVVACVGVAVGVPVGIVIGRLIWRTVSDSTGVAYSPAVSPLVLLATALGALAFAVIAATLAGRSAVRVSAALTFRTE